MKPSRCGSVPQANNVEIEPAFQQRNHSNAIRNRPLQRRGTYCQALAFRGFRGSAALHQWSGLYLLAGFVLVVIGIFYFAFATQLRREATHTTVYTVAGACGVFGGLIFAALALLR